MPCYQTNLISVDLKAADHSILLAAIKYLGLAMRNNNGQQEIITPAGLITIKDGQATFSNPEGQKIVNKIKQAYSIETINRIAKKYKFTVTVKSGNKMVLRRY